MAASLNTNRQLTPAILGNSTRLTNTRGGKGHLLFLPLDFGGHCVHRAEPVQLLLPALTLLYLRRGSGLTKGSHIGCWVAHGMLVVQASILYWGKCISGQTFPPRVMLTCHNASQEGGECVTRMASNAVVAEGFRADIANQSWHSDLLNQALAMSFASEYFTQP